MLLRKQERWRLAMCVFADAPAFAGALAFWDIAHYLAHNPFTDGRKSAPGGFSLWEPIWTATFA